MNQTPRSLSLIALCACALGLSACEPAQPPTVGEKIDAGIERTQQAATDAKRDALSATQDLKQDAAQAGAAIADGAADLAITTQVKAALAGDSQLSALAIQVQTHHKVVTLTGPAPTRAAAERATLLARAVDGVTNVQNHLALQSKP